MLRGQMSPLQLEFVLNAHRNLRLKFHQNQVSNSSDIADVELWANVTWTNVAWTNVTMESVQKKYAYSLFEYSNKVSTGMNRIR